MVSNGLCEHLRACEQCVYFCEHANSVFIFASTSIFQILPASSEHFRKIQMASSER